MINNNGMKEFLQNLPKIELHAHLNGSLCTESIRELGSEIYGECTAEFIKLCQRFKEFKEQSLEHCFQKFKFMHELTATTRDLQLATQFVIRDFTADKVAYLELRTTPKASVKMSKLDYLRCVLEVIQQTMNKQADIIVKLLPSIDRAQATAAAEETLKCVLELREEYPDIIVGLDFSGNPALGQFASFTKVLAKARALGLRLTLHCAEIDNNCEIVEMLEFGMDRCGHGTFLNKEQLKLLSQRNIPVECCLTSNIKCGTVSRYDEHHLKHLLAVKNEVVLCTDDSGVFDTTLTREFMIATQNFRLNSEDILELSMHAVKHAFASENEKSLLRKKLRHYFDDNKIC